MLRAEINTPTSSTIIESYAYKGEHYIDSIQLGKFILSADYWTVLPELSVNEQTVVSIDAFTASRQQTAEAMGVRNVLASQWRQSTYDKLGLPQQARWAF